MNKQAKKLLDLKDTIESNKEKKNRIEGRREELVKSIKKDFNCKTVGEARKLLKELEKELEKESSLLNKQINNLENSIKEGEKRSKENHKIFQSMLTGN